MPKCISESRYSIIDAWDINWAVNLVKSRFEKSSGQLKSVSSLLEVRDFFFELSGRKAIIFKKVMVSKLSGLGDNLKYSKFEIPRS